MFSGGPLTWLADSHYASPWTTQTQTTQIVIDKANSRAFVRAPDGIWLPPIGDPLIGSITAPYVTIETYLPVSSTDKRVRWQTFKASSSQSMLAEKMPAGAQIQAAQLTGFNTQTSSYTAKWIDQNRRILMNSTLATNFTIPPHSSVAFPVGAYLEVSQVNTGQVTVVAGSGVTINTSTSLLTRGQYSTLGFTQTAQDVWLATGDGQ